MLTQDNPVMDITVHKNIIRKSILQQRQQIGQFTTSATCDQSQRIITQLKDLITNLITHYLNYSKDYPQQPTIGLYYPLTGEPDITELIQSRIWLHQGWNLALPKIVANRMIYVHYQPGAKMERSIFNQLPQPINDIETTPLIIVAPGLSFSKSGYRIGFGKGYYDQYITNVEKQYPLIKIGLCFHDSLLTYVPFDQRDQKFDYIITNKTIIKL
jgi:5-formyltetrahydrofolate cyclo-ligase